MSAALSAPAVAGAAAVPGLNALLLPLLLSFGPAALSKLFGHDPNAQLRAQIQALLSPENLARLKARYYQDAVASPAFQQGLGAIATGANATTNAAAENLGARGLGGSGTRDIVSALGPSLVGSGLAGLRTAAGTQASQEAQGNIAAQIAALTGTQGPSQTQQLFAGGLESFTPFLTAWVRAKYPGLNFSAPKVGA